MKIIDYDIVYACDESEPFLSDKLVVNVQRQMKLGFEPLGGVCVVRTSLETRLYQAMVKYERPKVIKRNV